MKIRSPKSKGNFKSTICELVAGRAEAARQRRVL